VEDRIKQLRWQYPRWGKDKLVILLSKEGIRVSASTVGRVIKRLKESGILKEPINDAIRPSVWFSIIRNISWSLGKL